MAPRVGAEADGRVELLLDRFEEAALPAAEGSPVFIVHAEPPTDCTTKGTENDFTALWPDLAEQEVAARGLHRLELVRACAGAATPRGGSRNHPCRVIMPRNHAT